MPSVPPVNNGVFKTESQADSLPSAISDPIGESWQAEFATAIRSSTELLAAVGLPEVGNPHAADDFPVLVPRNFVSRMEYGNPNDPLLLQVLGQAAEDLAVEGFLSDPVGDGAARKTPGLLQKYFGRVLLITTGTCAVHCRYCFRREYPYQEDPRTLDELNPALTEISSDTSIREVILSGGDPLVLSDSRLRKVLRLIDDIPHIERIRIHTRVPIVIPSRVTAELLASLTELRAQPIMVVHANHGNEIVADCRDALREFVRSGIPVLNQAVLLKNVNDTVNALEQLCTRLANIGVMPYYLHQLDRVNGAAHFEVDDAHAQALVEQLRRRLPGYAVPQLVREVQGAESKTPLQNNACIR